MGSQIEEPTEITDPDLAQKEFEKLIEEEFGDIFGTDDPSQTETEYIDPDEIMDPYGSDIEIPDETEATTEPVDPQETGDPTEPAETARQRSRR